MTKEEQAFWDACAVAALGGASSDPSIVTFDAAAIWALGCAEVMLKARREQQAKLSTSA